jgi:hypothetical protein
MNKLYHVVDTALSMCMEYSISMNCAQKITYFHYTEIEIMK